MHMNEHIVRVSDLKYIESILVVVFALSAVQKPMREHKILQIN